MRSTDSKESLQNSGRRSSDTPRSVRSSASTCSDVASDLRQRLNQMGEKLQSVSSSPGPMDTTEGDRQRNLRKRTFDSAIDDNNRRKLSRTEDNSTDAGIGVFVDDEDKEFGLQIMTEDGAIESAANLIIVEEDDSAAFPSCATNDGSSLLYQPQRKESSVFKKIKESDAVILPSPLCCCRSVSVVRSEESPPLLCQAISSVDGKGKFYECRAGRPAHYFHIGCSVALNRQCPHCAANSDHFYQTEINVCFEKSEYEDPFALFNGAASEREIAKIANTTNPKNDSTIDSTDNLELPNQRSVSCDLLRNDDDQKQLSAIIKEIRRCEGNEFDSFTMKFAVDSGNLTAVVALLLNGADPNETLDENKNRPLHVAVDNGKFLMSYVLLQAGSDANLTNSAGFTPLMIACERGFAPLVNLLLVFGADPAIKCFYRETGCSTALHIAAVNGHFGAAQHLLKSRLIDVNARDDGGWTALSWATEHGQSLIANRLLDQGARPMLMDMEGNICMHWAAYSGSLPIAERLIRTTGLRALRAENAFGDRPLHVASRRKQWELIRLILAKGADPTVMNHKSETALTILAALDDVPADMQLLLDLAAKKIEGNRKTGVVTSERILDTDMSRGREPCPLSCSNEVDDETPPADFQYVQTLVETLDQLDIRRRIDQLEHCDCADDCSSGDCRCSMLNGQQSIVYQEDRRLSERFDWERTDTVFECNPACRCNANCQNRVGQKGINSHLQVFRTRGRGWGVRALEVILQGTFVCEYAGEIIPSEAADARHDDSYFFEMASSGCAPCIDAKFYGNVSRFVNHGCRPNLQPLKILWDHQDERFPHIGLFASRDIAQGEELTFDYGEKFWIVKYKEFRCTCDAGPLHCRYSDRNIAAFLAEHQMQQQLDIDRNRLFGPAPS